MGIIIATVLFFVIVIGTELTVAYIQYNNSIYYKQKKDEFIKVFFNAGAYGEARTSMALEKIDKNSKFLFNVYIPKNNDLTEIDIIYINPKGIFVIENKNYNGWIFGKDTDQKWCQSLNPQTKNFFYNPIKQNQTHIKYLKETLKIENLCIENVKSIVSFNNRATLKKIKNNSECIVTNSNNLQNEIKKILKNSIENIDVNLIYDKLAKYANVTEEQKQEHINKINSKYNRQQN
jgi:Nuclease-related domain.